MKIIDLHCDTLYKFAKGEYSIKENNGHITEEKLRTGDYLGQCFAIYLPAKIKREDGFLFFKEQYGKFLKLIAESKILETAKTFANVRENVNNSKISAILTVENADFLNGDIDRIDYVKKCGVKFLGLTHNEENCLGFPHSSYIALDNLPLKNFGREVVEVLNYTNITVDVSHLSNGGFNDVARISKKPFVATHSACRNLQNHSRNLYDWQIKIIANSGGIIGVPFYAEFLNGGVKTEISDIICHIEHIIKIGGEEAVAFGTDFDGMQCDMFLQTCAEMPILADTVIKKFGYSVAEKICYKNALKVLK